MVELQRDSLNPAADVSDLLRKALLIANKLSIPDLNIWIENELGGYRDLKGVPPYRIITGQVMAQDNWGRWVPVLFQNTDVLATIATVRLPDPVAEIEALLQRTLRLKECDGNLSVDFSPEQEAILGRDSQNGLIRHTRFIRTEDLKGLLDAVRTEILKWSLKLEKDGILGEGMTFSKDEQQKAAAVHYTTNFYGSVGNVAQNSEHFSQTAGIGVQPKDLARLATELTAHLNELNLDARQRQRAEAQIATLKAELAGDPDFAIVRQAGRTLRNITEGAIGSLLATAAQPGVWHWIYQQLSNFGAA
ncbi:MAG: hypothetical protein ABSG79_11400 [Bryobacteraceae bacterium]